MKNYRTINKAQRSGTICYNIAGGAIVMALIIIVLQSFTNVVKVCLDKSYTLEQSNDLPNPNMVLQGNEIWKKGRNNNENYRTLDVDGNITMVPKHLSYDAFESYGKEDYNSQSNYNKRPAIKKNTGKAYYTPFISEDSRKKHHIIPLINCRDRDSEIK